MSASFVQSAIATFASSNGKTLSYTNANTAGNMLFAVVNASTLQTVSISDTQGNTWVPLTASGTFNTTQKLSAFYALNCKGGSNTVTTSFVSSAASNDLVVLEYSGVVSFDQQAIQVGSSTTPLSPSFTTTNANTLIVGYMASAAGSLNVNFSRMTPRANDGGFTFAGEVPGFFGSLFSTEGICTNGAWAAGVVSFVATGVSSSAIWAKQGPCNGLVSGVGTQFGGLYEAAVLYEANAKILSGTVFKMWYNGSSGVRYAESTDGINFTDYGSNPVIANKYKSRIFKNAGTYYLPVVDASSSPTHADIYSSSDGVAWSLLQANALTTNATAWDNAALYHMNIVGIVGGTWYALYDCNNITGLATSSDGLAWTKYANNPVLGAHASQAYLIGNTYYAWCSLVDAGNPGAFAPIDTVRSSSPDLINWTTPQLVFPRTLTHEGLGPTTNIAGEASDPNLVEANGKTYLYYSAGSNSGSDGTLGYQQHVAIANMPMANLVATAEGVSSVITLVNKVTANAASGASIATAATNHTGGNLLVVAVQHGTNFVDDVSLADTAGNTYVKAIDDQTAGANIGTISLWYAKNCRGNANNVVTATFSNGSQGFPVIAVLQYSGCDTVNPLDVATKGVTSGTTVTSAAFTTTAANEVIVAAAAFASLTGTFGAGSGYLLETSSNGSGNGCNGTEDNIVASIQTSVTATATSSVAVGAAILVASFKAATANPSAVGWLSGHRAFIDKRGSGRLR